MNPNPTPPIDPRTPAWIAGLLWALTCSAGVSPGVDEHTVALWLFDEPNYPNVLLTDASPHQYDLRFQSAYGEWWVRTEGKGEPPAKPLHLEGKYGLVPGKFGRALHAPGTAIARVVWPDNRQRYSSAPMVGSSNDVPERFNIGYFDWTIEFWFKAEGSQQGTATLYKVRNEQDYPRGLPMENALRLAPDRTAFVLVSRTTTETSADIGGPSATHLFELPVPTDTARLNDGGWHHLAFTYTAAERQLRHFVDGRLQPLPGKGGFLPMLGVLKELTICEDLAASIDEYRLSGVARYARDFAPPGSFSRAHGLDPRPVNRPNGPPLLFAAGRDPAAPLALGSRKHVLIDGAIVDTKSNIAFRPQPPQVREVTGFRNTEPWEPTARMGSTIPDLVTVWDEGEELRMLYTNSGMFSGKPHVICLAVSRDGLHWEKPVLGLHSWEGERDTNIVIAHAGQGALIKDSNPASAPDERYKLLLYATYRGYYLFTSGDGVHFRRNETVGHPFDNDGSTTFYWDDQRGLYHAYFRAVSEQREIRRRTGHMEIPDLFTPWPFKPTEWPWIDDLVLARPARGEMPIIDTGGQVYRFKAHKYEWAPDTYVAFPWRYVFEANVRPGSFLMVSRNGTHWTRYEDPYYFPSGWNLDGREVLEALMEHGIIRRGDKLWQYGTVRFTEHGGALYGGKEHEGGIHDRLVRLEQRLDGFVAVVPEDGTAAGSLVTKPLTFTGERLVLNADASGGSVRVELQDATGKPIPGFTLAECVPFRENAVAGRATWKSGSNLASIAGRPVRLNIEVARARLFAFQFQ